MLRVARRLLVAAGMTKTLARSLLLVAAASGLAAAEPTVSLSTNPLVDLIGLADVQVETRVADHVGVAAIAGAGKVAWDSGAPSYELGARGSYYLTRAFSGWNVGAEALHARSLHTYEMGDTPSFSMAGAFGGYKWLLASGFTGDLRVGVAVAHTNLGTTKPENDVLPLVSGSLGYTF